MYEVGWEGFTLGGRVVTRGVFVATGAVYHTALIWYDQFSQTVGGSGTGRYLKLLYLFSLPLGYFVGYTTRGDNFLI